MSKPKHGLVLELPGGTIRNYLLSAERVVVGRAGDNTIRLDVDTVSSHHCELRRRGDAFFLVDLGSTNGTRLNGETIASRSRELHDGDELRIGLDVCARFVRLIELEDPPGGESSGSGSDTKKLDNVKRPATPSINPVAAAVARAGKTARERR